MYRLYRNWIIDGHHDLDDDGDRIGCVSECVYFEIVNYEKNIAFFKPKKDLCNKCEKWTAMEKVGTLEENDKHDKEQHQQSKKETRNARALDVSQSTKDSADVLVASFDLENVFSLP